MCLASAQRLIFGAYQNERTRLPRTGTKEGTFQVADGRWWRPGAVSGATRPWLGAWPMAYDAPGGGVGRYARPA
eukprot:2812277-Prymnesium_polylepis.1